MNKTTKRVGIAALVILGANAVFGILNTKKANDLKEKYDTAVTFRSDRVDMEGKGSVTSVGVMFGGAEIDYRNCPVLDEPYELTLYNKFSGVEVVVPAEWHVQTKGKIAFGGVENYTATYDDKEPNLIIHFNTSFSGLSIKNEKYS